MSLSRQGLRRLTALNPSTAFHDSFSVTEKRFPRITLDLPRSKQDPNMNIRKSYLKERDMKRFQKMGVLRTNHHNICGLADCEFLSVSDLVTAARAATELSRTGVNVDAFFEQLSARLRKDVDLVPINDLIAVLQEFFNNDYLDIGLVNKIKNEVVFDMNRVGGSELGVVLHVVLGYWNIVSAKLIRASLRRAQVLVDERSIDRLAISLILKSLKNCPNTLVLKCSPGIRVLAKALSDVSFGELSFAELVSTTSSIQWLNQRTKVDLPVQPLVNEVLTKNVSDVESAADALSLALSVGDYSEEDLKNVADSLQVYSSDVVAACSLDSNSVESIEKRNKAANITATIVASCIQAGKFENLVGVYLPSLTDTSVRGLRTHQLVRLVGLVDDGLRPVIVSELKRKYPSLSERQVDAVKAFF